MGANGHDLDDSTGANRRGGNLQLGRPGFCIFIDTLCQGPTVAVTEGEGVPCVFGTEREAQLEIVDAMLIKLEQFIDRERDFDDAITTDEYVVRVWVQADGSILDECGDPVVARH